MSKFQVDKVMREAILDPKVASAFKADTEKFLEGRDLTRSRKKSIDRCRLRHALSPRRAPLSSQWIHAIGVERRQGGLERRVQKKYCAFRLPGLFDINGSNR